VRGLSSCGGWRAGGEGGTTVGIGVAPRRGRRGPGSELRRQVSPLPAERPRFQVAHGQAATRRPGSTLDGCKTNPTQARGLAHEVIWAGHDPPFNLESAPDGGFLIRWQRIRLIP